MPTEELAIREMVAVAIADADRSTIEDGYADKNEWPDHFSDWTAHMADRVLKEIYDRGYMIARRAGATTSPWPHEAAG